MRDPPTSSGSAPELTPNSRAGDQAKHRQWPTAITASTRSDSWAEQGYKVEFEPIIKTHASQPRESLLYRVGREETTGGDQTCEQRTQAYSTPNDWPRDSHSDA
jgi:hypothetical protein